MPHRLDRGRSTLDAATFKGPVKIGLDGSDIKQLKRYTPTLSPAAVAANTTAEQTFTVTGLAVGDVVIAVNKPTAQAGLSIAGYRVSAVNTLAITFGNHTGASITPTAGQTYELLVWRP